MPSREPVRILATPDSDSAELLSQLTPSSLPDHLLALTASRASGPVALYVLDLEGRYLRLMNGDERFPEEIPTNEGLGPELGRGSVAPVRAALAASVPGAEPFPLWVHERATAMLVAVGGQAAELEALASAAGPAVELAGGYTDIFERARRRLPVSAGAEAQQAMLVPRIARCRGAGLAGGILPAYDAGGDFFDHAHNPEGTWLAVADAMGRGAPGAATAALALGALRAARRDDSTLEEACLGMHETIRALPEPRPFVTALVARWEPEQALLRWVTCGHPRPLLLHPHGRVEPLEGEVTYPLGLFGAGREFVVNQRLLRPGSRVLLYSDGATERRGEEGRFFGLERLTRALIDTREEPPAAALAGIQRQLISFAEEPLLDDATLLMLAVDPSREGRFGRPAAAAA